MNQRSHSAGDLIVFSKTFFWQFQNSVLVWFIPFANHKGVITYKNRTQAINVMLTSGKNLLKIRSKFIPLLDSGTVLFSFRLATVLHANSALNKMFYTQVYSLKMQRAAASISAAVSKVIYYYYYLKTPKHKLNEYFNLASNYSVALKLNNQTH